MTTLTFDFTNSYRGVNHTVETYDPFVEHLSLTLSGYNQKSFADMVYPFTVHSEDGSTVVMDHGPELHLENTFGVSGRLALSHSPASDHYDLWDPFSHPQGLYLRISANVPPPPAWADYMLHDYYSNGDRDFGADYAAWATQWNEWTDSKWAFSGGELAGGSLIPRTDAILADHGGKLGTIHASDALDPELLLDIAHYQAVVLGSRFDDKLDGGRFDDKLYGAAGDDTLGGNQGDDSLDGGMGRDHLFGHQGNDTLVGGGDDDVLFASSGDDKLEGGKGDDELQGMIGSDTLVGSAGDDDLYGGGGADDLFGGSGDDRFQFLEISGVDDIEDFKHGGDKIVLSAHVFKNIGNLNQSFHDGPHATDANDRIIYWHSILYYDPDGTGDADQVAFARIVNGVALTHSDFFVVA